MQKNAKNIPFRIVVDTREQSPFSFFCYGVQVERSTLHTGDYSLAGFENLLTLERKSMSDLAGCMTSGRERFERELLRMREFESAAVIVEEPLIAIRSGTYRSRLNPVSFEQSILSFMIRFRVPFLFGRNREYAEWLTFNALRHFFNSQVPESQKIPYTPPPDNQ